MMRTLNEGLEYMDMKDQLKNTITVDEYAAKMGPDKDIVTLTFMVNSKLAGTDLVTWFERGYDWVLDASISDGELEPGKYLVFVEMDRRSKVPTRICDLLSDLETLTGIKLKNWKINIEGTVVPADPIIIAKNMILNPNEYKARKESEEELNEFRTIAGLKTKPTYSEDEYIKNIKDMARI
jgi:hypothetical protein